MSLNLRESEHPLMPHLRTIFLICPYMFCLDKYSERNQRFLRQIGMIVLQKHPLEKSVSCAENQVGSADSERWSQTLSASVTCFE